MKTLKRIFGILLVLAMLCTLAACSGNDSKNPDSGNAGANNSGSNNADSDNYDVYDKVTLTFSNPYLESTPHGIALNAFSEYVSEHSGGRVKIDVFHNAELGVEAEADKGVLNGSIDMTFSGTSGIGNTIPATACIESWFAFDGIDQVKETVSIIHDDLVAAFADVGLAYLGLYIDGPRMMLTPTPITTLEDFQHFKMRLPTSTIYINAMDALGASGVVMTLNDTYTGLQTGSVHGTEGSLSLLYSQKQYEQCSYLTRSDHTWQGLYIYANAETWNSLNAETQQLILDGLAASQSVCEEEWEKNQTELLTALENEGIEILELEDRENWVEAVQQTNYDYAASTGELGLKMYEVVQQLRGNN